MKFVIALVLMASVALARPQNGFEDDYFDPNPKCRFEYKVASDETQTYMTQEESRDGDFVTGQYTYVDANGSLVTVTYEAGPEGYSESRDIQEGFINVVNKK
uniref:Cuticle protein 7 n=1 Tax=Lepeophtheirus salmonis TaxID=72036 RepID=C1BUL7_LEPSM|nr:Cuticle protein 7 [Lepeophtheirus salmonis]